MATRYHHPSPAELEDPAPAWDNFAGPAALLPDDRVPLPVQPLVFATRTVAFALEMNGKILKGLTERSE